MNGLLSRRLATVVRRALESGRRVEIDGLGIFLPGKNGFQFVAHNKPQVFIAYVEEDFRAAAKLYRGLERNGFRAWLDRKKLMPGQNWPRAIETAIQTSDFFVACFSQRSLIKRGCFQSELRYALSCAARVPLDEIFFIPARLDACAVPGPIARRIQYVDLFPDWERGLKRMLEMMNAQQRNRKRKQLPLAG